MSQSPDKDRVLVITVEDVKYTLDCNQFTPRECGLIKRIGNVRGVAEIPQALVAGDMELVVALAVVAAKRAGKILNPEALMDGEGGLILVNIPSETDDNPPTEAAEE